MHPMKPAGMAPRTVARAGRIGRLTGLFLVSTGMAISAGSTLVRAAPSYALAMHGTPALPENFDHLPYSNPAAPKGGKITYGFVGSFDSLNPLIVNGNAPRGIMDPALTGNNVYETLLARSADEPFTLYGLLARTVEVPDDRSWVEFHLNPNAKFSDGEPVTVDDVIFTVDLLKTRGRPLYRSRFAKVADIAPVGTDGIRFRFGADADRELPLLIGLTPILPKHATDPATFDQSSLKIPVGSGPYTITKVEPGTSLTLTRRPNYWGKDLPVKRGLDNFDTIRIDYYRDANTYFEAFKAGQFDVLFEDNPARWATGYDFPALQRGEVIKDAVTDGTPKGMNGMVFNTRRPLFADPRVREALGLLFDFEWANKNLFFGLYSRSGSYFQGSRLSALGKPADGKEQALLKPYSGEVLPEVMDGTYRPPVSDGSGRDRTNLRKALGLLDAAGWTLKDNTLVNRATGQPFTFEFLAMTREQERLALSYQASLKLVGITMSVRLVDSNQFWDRQKKIDFDMMQVLWTASLSPGNEQNFRWSSQSATTEGTFNYAGVQSRGVDDMIAALLSARDQPDFEVAVRALDRLLISGRYVVPLFNLPQTLIARWTRIERPSVVPLYGVQPITWWAKP